MVTNSEIHLINCTKKNVIGKKKSVSLSKEVLKVLRVLEDLEVVRDLKDLKEKISIIQKNSDDMRKNIENNNEKIKIVLMSFNPFAVLRFSKLNPLIPRVQLKEKGYPLLHLYPNPGNPEIVGPGIGRRRW